jgi:ferric-dicitrate binding protein FerR (iron transport regulator)
MCIHIQKHLINEMAQQIDKRLIRKYLAGECSDTELQLMARFLEREDAEQLIDEVWAEEWEQFQEAAISDREIESWKNLFLKTRLGDDDRPAGEDRSGKRFFTLRYAAMWLVLLAGFGTWYGISRMEQPKVSATAVTLFKRVNADGQRVQIRLSDSSVVYLGGGSKLLYPSHFTGSTREITLEGEAFFEVAKNPKKPFIIRTGSIKTIVVGTSFRIDAFKSKPFLIEVATGKVRIAEEQQNDTAQLAILTPGQSLMWKDHQAILGRVNADDVAEWKNGRLVFNRATLRGIAGVLERWYDVDIIFKHQPKAEQHMTITLTANVPLSEILQVLAGAGKFQYKISGRQIIIN